MTLHIDDVLGDVRIALRGGLVVLLPRDVLDQVPAHPHGKVRALETHIRGDEGIHVLADAIGCLELVAVRCPERLVGHDREQLRRLLDAALIQGPDGPAARELLENRIPVPDTRLHALATGVPA